MFKKFIFLAFSSLQTQGGCAVLRWRPVVLRHGLRLVHRRHNHVAPVARSLPPQPQCRPFIYLFIYLFSHTRTHAPRQHGHVHHLYTRPYGLYDHIHHITHTHTRTHAVHFANNHCSQEAPTYTHFFLFLKQNVSIQGLFRPPPPPSLVCFRLSPPQPDHALTTCVVLQ